MNRIIIHLCKFRTLYLWILALKVLQVSAAEYRTDTPAAAATLIMKPYPYQIFDDYMDELFNERNVATPLWQTQDKHLYYKHLPLTKAKIATGNINGNSLASNEMAFENLNDFDSYKIKNAIWPRDEQNEQHLPDDTIVDDKFKQQQRHSLQHVDAFDKLTTPVTNIRYENGILPIIMAKRLTKEIPTIKKSKTFAHDANDDDDDDTAGIRNDVVKDNIFPLKDDDAFIEDDGEDENDFTSSNGNGNESINYSDDNEVNTNYMVSHNFDVNDKGGIDKNHMYFKLSMKDKRAKPSHGHTPFLPSVSGGAMTNLGKFFRDLSKNVHFSEQYQWGTEDQKLLEGDPNFGNIHHHLTKPKSTTDQQTSEWIKAIRFYRPSQKIRSLVAMNPHGQWAHSSQFIDPNYMWVGLGK